MSISQPSLTNQIKVLEGQLDIKLFQKVGRRNKLTENGSIVFGYCRRMFEISEEMSEVVLKRLPSATRRIHIGVSDDVERTFVVEVDIIVTETLVSEPTLMNLARADSPVVLVCSMKSKEGKGLSKGKGRGDSIARILKSSVSQWLMPSTRFKLRSEIDQLSMILVWLFFRFCI